MIVIPAVDIKGGKVVRLTQGLADKERVYSESPVEMARKWASLGVELIHIVDLDGALQGELKNLRIVQDDRSQHRNREQAMKVLVSRIMDAREREKHQLEAQTRKSRLGSGDRSDRIRTYNFPQGRITDHRINLTLYKIDAMMDGDIDDLCNALASEHQAELLAALGDS